VRRILVALVLFAAALWLGRRVTFDRDIARLVPDTSPELERASLLMRHALDRAVVDVGGDVDVGTLTEATDAFADALRATGRVAGVRERMSEGGAMALIEMLRLRAARLLRPGQLEQQVRPRLEPDAVKERIQTLLRRLQEPDGAHLQWSASHDPLGITNLALAPLGALTAGFREARIEDGRILSADGRHALVLVEPGFSATDATRTEEFLEAMESATEQVKTRFPGVRVSHMGTHRSTADNALQIESDVRLTTGLGIPLVAVLTLLVFGRMRPALLAMTPALYGGALALGIYSLLGDSIAAAVAGFAAVLLGVTIDYAVHVLYRLDAIPVRAILMGATTTAAAFLSLRLSSLPGVRDIGLFGALGISAAALFAVFVLPTIAGRPKQGRRRLDLEALARRLRGPRVRRVALWTLILATPVVAFGIGRLRLEGDVMKLSSLSPDARADEAEIQRVWGAAFRVSNILVEGETLQDALSANDRLDGVLRKLDLTAYGSLSGLLPARATQDERLAAWHAFWTRERVAGLRESLAAAIVDTPFREDAFEPFFAWLGEDPAPLTPETFQEGGLGNFISDRIMNADDAVLVATPVFAEDFEETERVVQALKREMPGAALINRERLVRRMAEMVGSDTVTLGLSAFLVVTALVSIWLGSATLTFVVVVPLLISCAWTFGLLGWIGLPITLSNAIFVAFLFGLAVDYAIFLTHSRLERFRGEEDRTASAEASVMLCALTTCAGFGVLTAAGHPVLYSIGTTALLGIASSLAITLVAVPALAGVVLRPPAQDADIKRSYRYLGAVVSHYAPSKAKHDPLVRALPALAADASEVLVAGCGYGIMTFDLARAGTGRLRAIDFDAGKVRVAQAALAGRGAVDFVVGDLRETDLGSPDFALVVDVLHYWPPEEQARILGRVVDAMQPGPADTGSFTRARPSRDAWDSRARAESFISAAKRAGIISWSSAGWRSKPNDPNSVSSPTWSCYVARRTHRRTETPHRRHARTRGRDARGGRDRSPAIRRGPGTRLHRRARAGRDGGTPLRHQDEEDDRREGRLRLGAHPGRVCRGQPLMHRMHRMHRLALLLALAAPLAGEPDERVILRGKEREAFLDRLEGRMQKVQSFVAEFDQEKELVFFKDVVKSSGVLLFQRPDQMRWEILRKYHSILIVSGREVAKFEFVGGKRRALRLGRSKDAILIAMERIRSWFKGEFDRKGKTYAADVSEKPTPLIVLRPRDKALRRNLEAIEFAPTKDLSAIRKVTIRERDGNRTVMTFHTRTLDVKIPAELFALDDPADVDLEKLRRGAR